MPDMPIGQLVKLYRMDQKRTTANVATLAGISVRHLERIEAGTKTPSIAALTRLAKVFGVSTAALIGELPTTENNTLAGPRLSDVQAALYSYKSLASNTTTPTLEELRDSVASAWDSWETSPNKFSDVVPLLPQLITDAEAVVRDQGYSREACRVASELYQLVRPTLKESGRTDLVGLAADRVMRYAEATDDPLLIGAAQWNLGMSFMTNDMPENAYEIGTRAAEALRPRLSDGAEETFSVYGGLLQMTSIASARNGDPYKGRELLRGPARQAADRVGDGKNYHHMYFGPTNLTMHTSSIELEAGEASDCIRIGNDVDISRINFVERKTRNLYDLAQAYACKGNDTAVFVHLKMAYDICPDDFQHRRVVRHQVSTLVRRAKPSYSAEVRRFAHQIGLLD